MARGKRAKGKLVKKPKEVERKNKEELARNEHERKTEETHLNRPSSWFKSEEMQEIRQLMNFDEQNQEHCFKGAVVIGKFDIVKKMLKGGYNIDTIDENQETALMHTVKHFQLEMFNFLVTRGADICLVDRQGNNVLQLAAQNALWDQDSFYGLWQSLSDHPRLPLDHSNKAGYCLLHYVTERQWQLILELLMARTTNVNCCTNEGLTPLIMAASTADSSCVQTLLKAGADITIEDQQMCTALCYAIADQMCCGSEGKSDQALVLLLTAFYDQQSKINLELYLERRLMLITYPPKSKTEFAKTVSSVIGHVLTFFARFVYSGLEILLKLQLFHRLAESLVLHMDEPKYLIAVLTIVSELVRHCDCCCKGQSRVQLADAFFSADLGKILLEILNRYGSGETGMIKAVFLPLLLVCSSSSYLARLWLERHYLALLSFYDQYTRLFPAMFMVSSSDKHLQVENQCALSFQGIMKTLKTTSSIVTKEEHSRASLKLINKPMTTSNVSKKIRISTDSSSVEQTNLKPSAVYKSIIQQNFGKLNIIKNKIYSPKSPREAQMKTANMKIDAIHPLVPLEQLKAEQTPRNVIKSRIAIKEIQLQLDSELVKNNHLSNLQTDKYTLGENETDKTESLLTKNYPKSDLKQDTKDKFSEGYQLFQMEEISSSEDESPSKCEWLDTNAIGDGNKVVNNAQVASTLTDLEEIFNRIVKRYNSTWLKQYQEGYLGAQGDSEDFLMLMKVLPALEEFHIRKLLGKWLKFCKQIKDYARKNHIVYAATVSEMQLFLLEFESELEKKNYKIFEETNVSKSNHRLSLEELRQNSNIKCNGTSTVLTHQKLRNKNICILSTNTKVNERLKQNEKIKNRPVPSLNEFADFGNKDYFSGPENENSSIWNGKIKTLVSHEQQLFANINEVIQKENSINPSKKTEILDTDKKEEVQDSTVDIKLAILLTNTDKIQNENCQAIKTKEYCLGTSFPDTLQVLCEHYNQGSLEDSQGPEQLEVENNSVIREGVNSTTKTLPGNDCVIPANSLFNYLASAPNYCGTKYQTLSLALATLPSCQTELLADGRLRLANIDFQFDFKLFTGFNFGDVELGINTVGVPLAVRRFQKVETQCNKLISSILVKTVTSMLHLSHPHILPYLACYDLSYAVVFVTPLCYHDLGQHIRQLRNSLTRNIDCFTQITPHLVTLAKQLLLGLHFLHTRDKVIIHGNLKPSNIMVDNSGTLRLAEFGLHEIVFQQRSPATTSVIWWSQECIKLYFSSCKFVCTEKSDMQTAGMLVHFILTLGHHPFGQSLSDITDNIKQGVIQLRCIDPLAIDLIYWQLSKEPRQRPTTHDTLRHVMFWSSEKKWRFLQVCCGLGPQHFQPLPLAILYRDLDLVGKLRDINTKWITVMKENCKTNVETKGFEDTPSGLLRFLCKNLTTWTEFKYIFLELFPVLPLNLFRLLEQTEWIHHPQFELFIRITT